MEKTFRLAIVGAGPSCTYIVERLAATASQLADGLRLHLDVFDRSGQFGAGSVHSTEQPRTSYLNRIVGQVAFAADESVQGAGPLLDAEQRPTLHEWCRRRFEQTGDPTFDLAAEDWPKRYVHGLALRESFQRFVEILASHEGVTVELHETEVVDLVDRGQRLELLTADGDARLADHVVLATGHSANQPLRPRERELAEFAARSATTYVPSAYPLEEHVVGEVAAPGSVVACNGMGLTAIDIALYLTEARGGRFERAENGRLRYLPSGREPRLIVPFSESGLFTFARPYNGKEVDLDRFQHRSVFLTREAIDRLRASVGRPGADAERPQIDFERDVFPVLLLEMAHLYYRTLLGEELGAQLRECATPAYERFLDGDVGGGAASLLAAADQIFDEAVQLLDPVLAGTSDHAVLSRGERSWSAERAFRRHLEVVFGAEQGARAGDRIAGGEPVREALDGLASAHGHELELAGKRFSWEAAIEPIAAADQGDPESYRRAMLEFIERDHRWAAQGNLENPAKAAADGVWRDSRPVLAYAVDFGGLTAASHRAFLETYMRHHNRLANGAGLEVMERIQALAEHGLLDVSIGPEARVDLDEDAGCFRIVGGRTGAVVEADTLIGGTVHPFDPERDVLPLYPNLLRRGLIRKWRNADAAGGEAYEPGGLDLSSRFHPRRADGEVDGRLTLLGPPSEGVMFFQLGALRPNQDHHVMRDILCWLEDFRALVETGGEGDEAGAAAASEPAGEVVGSSISISEESPAASLRRQLARPRLLSVGGVHDALSALVAERCGLDALWASGLGIAASHGVADANILTLGEVRDAARLIAGASRLPVIADCDTGFGEVRNLRRTIAEFEHAGVAAVCIEDKLYPKRNSFGPASGQQLIDPYEFATKIRAAKDTQRSSELMVVARLESLIAGETVEEALGRARLYVAAGADAIVVHSKAKTPDQVIEFARRWRAEGFVTPLIAIPTTYHRVTAEQLERAGF
ncbi:MAG TPA: isocitrate lyase/phosphoenolpyruvate mutase family protein, partial [Solirubrobacterales bacterium]|nr:isocitrate lyase/phosphoenolpyruvate mutase family protein [Solirubrobacterales bacterium]